MKVREITPGELRQMLSGDAPPLLIDVREPWEADLVQLPGSLLIPLNSLPHGLQEIAPGRPVALYCHHGIRSLVAAEYMARAGYQALSLAGGIDRWAAEIEPDMRRY